MAAGWRTATIEEIAGKVAMGSFGSSIKVETFMPEGVPIISRHSHGGSDLVLRGPDLEEIPIGQLVALEEALRLSTIPFFVETRDWARLPESFCREIERDFVVLVERQK